MTPTDNKAKTKTSQAESIVAKSLTVCFKIHLSGWYGTVQVI